MPINDPIRDRKVAPNSLAFPIAGAGGGAASNSTYQTTVQTIEQNVVVFADSEIQNRDRHNLASADRDTEMRSKAYVSDWHYVLDWDIGADQEIENNKWEPLRFTNEALRTMGAFQTATAKWSWRVPNGADGTWWVYSHLSIQAQAVAAVTSARLGIIVNGTLRTVLDREDIEMAGDAVDHMRDIILRGGRNISLGVGDVVQIAVYLAGAVGDDTYGWPSSVVGYVSAHRTACGFDHVINSQDDNDGYNFV
jgi:hypothetical protein